MCIKTSHEINIQELILGKSWPVPTVTETSRLLFQFHMLFPIPFNLQATTYVQDQNGKQQD